jgi:hypothetical protein
MRGSRESLSKNTDESDGQSEKHNEQGIAAFQGIAIGWPLNDPWRMSATHGAAAREGKKPDDRITR